MRSNVVGDKMRARKDQNLWERRLLLQNPYAHIEELEQLRLEGLHENPYLYADKQIATDKVSASPCKRPDNSSIEGLVTKLQRDLWNQRIDLGLPTDVDPIELLNAEYAARIIGYDFSLHPSLGCIVRGRDRIVVAGVIDNSNRTIQIATDVDPNVARFTGAHEIGHAVLHPHLTSLHRDRPLNGANYSRERVEYEADKFAAFFLMPRKIVMHTFMSRFITPFKLRDETAYALLGKSYSTACELLPTRRHISRALAGAIQFNGRSFLSLTEYFGVSNESMAIRLEELGLVDG